MNRNYESIELTDRDFLDLSKIAQADFGINLPISKKTLVSNRLRKRLDELNLVSFRSYIDLLAKDEEIHEKDELIKLLTTNTTSFFREPHHFKLLEGELKSRLSDKLYDGRRVRIWSAGCSSGQEPYSIALVIKQVVPEFSKFDIKILATDIDPTIIERAERGVYPPRATNGLNAQLQAELFDIDGADIRVKKDLRELVTFRRLNLVEPYPMRGSFDVILCRNVAIYFDANTQSKVWGKIKDLLDTESILLIGHSEKLTAEISGEFESIGPTSYRYVGPEAEKPKLGV